MASYIRILSAPPSTDRGNQGNRIKKLQNLPMFDRRFYQPKVIFHSYPSPFKHPLPAGSAEKNSENFDRYFPERCLHRRRCPEALQPTEERGSTKNDR